MVEHLVEQKNPDTNKDIPHIKFHLQSYRTGKTRNLNDSLREQETQELTGEGYNGLL